MQCGEGGVLAGAEAQEFPRLTVCSRINMKRATTEHQKVSGNSALNRFRDAGERNATESTLGSRVPVATSHLL
jgi:hypothetical protein